MVFIVIRSLSVFKAAAHDQKKHVISNIKLDILYDIQMEILFGKNYTTNNI